MESSRVIVRFLSMGMLFLSMSVQAMHPDLSELAEFGASIIQLLGMQVHNQSLSVPERKELSGLAYELHNKLIVNRNIENISRKALDMFLQKAELEFQSQDELHIRLLEKLGRCAQDVKKNLDVLVKRYDSKRMFDLAMQKTKKELIGSLQKMIVLLGKIEASGMVAAKHLAAASFSQSVHIASNVLLNLKSLIICSMPIAKTALVSAVNKSYKALDAVLHASPAIIMALKNGAIVQIPNVKSAMVYSAQELVTLLGVLQQNSLAAMQALKNGAIVQIPNVKSAMVYSAQELVTLLGVLQQNSLAAMQALKNGAIAQIPNVKSAMLDSAQEMVRLLNELQQRTRSILTSYPTEIASFTAGAALAGSNVALDVSMSDVMKVWGSAAAVAVPLYVIPKIQKHFMKILVVGGAVASALAAHSLLSASGNIPVQTSDASTALMVEDQFAATPGSTTMKQIITLIDDIAMYQIEVVKICGDFIQSYSRTQNFTNPDDLLNAYNHDVSLFSQLDYSCEAPVNVQDNVGMIIPWGKMLAVSMVALTGKLIYKSHADMKLRREETRDIVKKLENFSDVDYVCQMLEKLALGMHSDLKASSKRQLYKVAQAMRATLAELPADSTIAQNILSHYFKTCANKFMPGEYAGRVVELTDAEVQAYNASRKNLNPLDLSERGLVLYNQGNQGQQSKSPCGAGVFSRSSSASSSSDSGEESIDCYSLSDSDEGMSRIISTSSSSSESESFSAEDVSVYPSLRERCVATVKSAVVNQCNRLCTNTTNALKSAGACVTQRTQEIIVNNRDNLSAAGAALISRAAFNSFAGVDFGINDAMRVVLATAVIAVPFYIAANYPTRASNAFLAGSVSAYAVALFMSALDIGHKK